MTVLHFADRCVASIRRLGSPLCVGLDPHLGRIPRRFGVHPDASLEQQAAGVQGFLEEVVQACAGRVAVVKPQIAFFEQLGFRGLEVLERVVAQARAAGLLVLLDAKRGDVGSTAEAYVRSYLLEDSPCRVDAITLNPYLGLDSLEPFVRAARDHGSGLFVLSRTSNPGASDFQGRSMGGAPLYQRVAEALAPAAASLVGSRGYSNLGVVAGATYPEAARRLRQTLPHSLFLVPGYGAQGAAASQALASFVQRDGTLEGGLVNSSRGVLFGDGDDGADVGRAVRARIDRAAKELASATRAQCPSTE